MTIQWYVIDSETNGLNSNKHEVNEISIIRVSDRVQLTEFIICEHPENSSFDALKVTGKTLADLNKGKSKEEVVDKVDRFLNEDGLTPPYRCFIAHNANFDRKFIHVLYSYIKQTGQKSLANLHAACDFVGIKKLSSAHNSKVDTRNTYLLYKDLIENKNVDYLKFIKSFPHVIDTNIDGEGLDPDLLD
jgi:DNA polymerase III epsilon subunit-like protein